MQRVTAKSTLTSIHGTSEVAAGQVPSREILGEVDAAEFTRSALAVTLPGNKSIPESFEDTDDSAND